MDLKDIALVLALLAAGFSLAALVWRGRPSRREEPGLEDLHDRIWRISESEERYRALVEATMEVIVQRDALGRVTFANDGFARLLGRAPLDLIGATLDLELLEQGPVSRGPDGVRRLEARVLPVDGQPRWFSFVEMPVARADGPVQWLRAGYDITARVEAARSLDGALARAEAANVAKSRFLATVSHEFRTPLNGILGMADLVLDTGLDPEQRTYVESVRTSGKALLTLIDGILDFSRIEAGRLDLAAEPFDVAALTEGVVELLAPRAQDKGIEIALDVADDLNPRVIGDADRVRQILINLAGNAIKFTATGGVALIVEPGIWPNEISFQVRDTGIGIAPEARERIFREFEQAEPHITRNYGGTGLGLSISDRIVKQMGGRIALQSALGAGATFTVSLPLRTASGHAGAAFIAPDLAGCAIMLATPQTIEATLIADRLQRWGAQTCLIGDPDVARALLPERIWRAVLIDRGFAAEIADDLAEAARGHAAQRIVLVTPATRQDLGASGSAFTGFLVKPLRAASLAARLSVADDAMASPLVVDDAAEPLPVAGASKLSVLVAEDNEINALLMRTLLTKLGHAVVVVADGEAAIESWSAATTAGAPYDVILMDIQMPDLDGIAATQRIRAQESAQTARRTPIVALTANALADDRNACFAAGMDGFLVKPVDREALEATLGALAPKASVAA